MIHEKLGINYVKCNGCTHSITKQLYQISGVRKAQLNAENATLEIDYECVTTRKEVITKLNAMGYPLATEENGFVMQAKSYANCIIGKSSVYLESTKSKL